MLHPSYVELMKVVNKNSDEIGEEPVVNSRYSIVCATAKREKPLSIAVDELYRGELQIISEDDEEQEEEA